jgi:hypothetical protein
MHDVPSVLAAWSNFYVITGSSSASLTGLMFVVVSLVAGRASNTTNTGFGTFSSPTVVHFCTAFVISGSLLAPWHLLLHPAVIIGLTGAFGVVYASRIIYSTSRLVEYEPLIEDWIWYGVVPFIMYLTIAAAAIALLRFPTEALFVLAGMTISLVLVGIHNAWDVVTYLAIYRSRDDQSS